MSKKYGYIYMTTDMTNGKIYIGQHRKSVFDEEYYGSGTWFTKALAKHGKKNFRRKVLAWCGSKEELDEEEKKQIELHQSRNPAIGYNLAEGGESATRGCTEKEKEAISKALFSADESSVEGIVHSMQEYGLRVYAAGEPWQPKSNNSHGDKMRESEKSVIVSLYVKRQEPIAKEYAEELGCNSWRYNIMTPIRKLPALLRRIKKDKADGILIAERKGVGQGTSGVFVETKKVARKSARMELVFP